MPGADWMVTLTSCAASMGCTFTKALSPLNLIMNRSRRSWPMASSPQKRGRTLSHKRKKSDNVPKNLNHHDNWACIWIPHSRFKPVDASFPLLRRQGQVCHHEQHVATCPNEATRTTFAFGPHTTHMARNFDRTVVDSQLPTGTGSCRNQTNRPTVVSLP